MRILLVEDTIAVRDAMCQLLETQGHVCETAGTAQDGWHLLQSEPFDLIVLDLNLPDRPGHSLLRDMQGAGMELAVFVVSARADLVDRVALLRAGADDYLVKPFDPKSLRRGLRRCCGGQKKSVRSMCIWAG